jgi:hypothetical protein
VSWRRVANRLRSARVTVAWTILGAGASLCLLHSRWLFDGGSWWGSGGGEVLSAGRVRVFGQLVFDDQLPGRIAHRVVDLWFLAVAGGLAALGGLGGLAFRHALRGRLRRSEPGDWWLCLAATAAVASTLAVTGVPGEDGESWCAWANRTFARPTWHANLVRLGIESLRLIAIALPLGWAVQCVAVAAGFRLTCGRRPDLAADYDDVHSAEPAGARDTGREND